MQGKNPQRMKMYEKILIRNNETVFYVSKRKIVTAVTFMMAFLLIGSASILLFDEDFFERSLVELRHYILETEDQDEEKQPEYLDDFADIYVVNKDEAPPDPEFLNRYPRWSRKIYNEITPATTNYTENHKVDSYTSGDKYDDLTGKVGSPTSVMKTSDDSEMTTYHASWSWYSDSQTMDSYYIFIEIEYEAKGNQIISKSFRAGKSGVD